MTGFDAYLQTVALPERLDVVSVTGLLTSWRKAAKRKVLPEGGAELLAIRKRGQRPACRIAVTDDPALADQMREAGDAWLLVIRGFNAYDFAPVYGMEVLYVVPDRGLWAIDIAHQIADAWPASLAIVWPGDFKEELLWN